MDNAIEKAAESSYELIAPCHFGLEAVLKKEIIGLGYEIVSTQDGRITFRGDERQLSKKLPRKIRLIHRLPPVAV